MFDTKYLTAKAPPFIGSGWSEIFNDHFRNMKRTKRQRFYGQRYTPQGYDYK